MIRRLARLIARARLTYFRLLAALYHAQAARAHYAKALKDEQRLRRMEIRMVAQQARMLKQIAAA